jgi:tetratricopeptide (TPR) repeat protein
VAQLRHAAEIAADGATRGRHRAVQHDCLGLPRLRPDLGGTDDERAEGIAILQRLLKVAPNHPSVPFWHYFLSFAYTEARDYRAAREHAQFAINIHPGFSLGWAQLANALGVLGETDAARHAIAQAQQANPRFRPDAYRRYMLAIAHEVGIDSVRRHTDGLVRAGLVPPLSEASAA